MPKAEVSPWRGAPVRKLAGKSRVLNVPPDPFDGRDVEYRPRPTLLTPVVPKGPLATVHDQGDEGTCTGFALAAVIETQLRRRGTKIVPSPRFLYEHAQRYDEWRGEEYEGSSLRGVMKGFWHHGACRWEALPYVAGQRIKRIPKAALDEADLRPLGAYYRIPTSDIAALQGAIVEAGAVLASAEVHHGWDRPKAPPKANKGELPDIDFSRARATLGGHAFALVGFDERGFVVHNSWGTKWGKAGLARLSYEDWLTNRTDAWVAQVGLGRVSITIEARRDPSPAGEDPVARVREEQIRGHFLAIKNGDFDRRGPLQSDADDIPEILRRIRAWAPRTGPIRVLIYAHGGLVNERSAAAKALEFVQALPRNGIYPIHMLWHSGFFEAFFDVLRNRTGAEMPVGRSLRDRWDDGIEARMFRRGFGRRLWTEMKKDAAAVVLGGVPGRKGPLALLLDALATEPRIEVHMLGHSAGSIVTAEALAAAVRSARPPRSLAYMAPAIRADEFSRLVMPNARNSSFRMWTMPDRDERDDHCARLYGKSLLYLVSNAFEPSVPTPLLGLARNIDRDHEGKTGAVVRDVAAWLAQRRAVTLQRPDKGFLGTLHSAFDDDPAIVNAWMTWVLGAPPRFPYKAG